MLNNFTPTIGRKRVTIFVKDSMCVRQSCGWRHGYLNLPQPQYMSEFDILSELVWDTKIGIQKLGIYSNSCQYQIEKIYDSYAKEPERRFAKLYKTSSYELNRVFCASIFGQLSCGGIGGYAYGQTYLRSYRHKVALESRRH